MIEHDTQTERVTCRIWHSPLFILVPDGLIIKCKSCRGASHHITREELEQKWEAMAKNKPVIEGK